MCIICLEFQRTKDLFDARFMLANARREPGAIAREHLDEIEEVLELAEAQAKAKAEAAAAAGAAQSTHQTPDCKAPQKK